MKQIVCTLFFILLLVSCGSRSGHFKMEGHLLHINQGELYVYSPDGAIDGLDTIKIQGGRFTYEVPSQYAATLVLVFPNFSTQPIFTKPGEAVDIKADAARLKEMEVEGTDANELMTDFRKAIASASPPEVVKLATTFIEQHPESAVGVYLVRKYLVETESPDYKKAVKLAELMHQHQPENGAIVRLMAQLKGLKEATIGEKLPRFSAKDLNGKVITSGDLNGKEVIINVWASWNYESMETQRILNQMAKDGKVKVIGVSLEPTANEARNALKANGIEFQNICDGMMFESSVLKTLGLNTVPDNIIVKNGRIVERRINSNTLRERQNNQK